MFHGFNNNQSILNKLLLLKVFFRLFITYYLYERISEKRRPFKKQIFKKNFFLVFFHLFGALIKPSQKNFCNKNSSFLLRVAMIKKVLTFFIILIILFIYFL